MTEPIALVGGPADGLALEIPAGHDVYEHLSPMHEVRCKMELACFSGPGTMTISRYVTYRRSGRATREGRAVFTLED